MVITILRDANSKDKDACQITCSSKVCVLLMNCKACSLTISAAYQVSFTWNFCYNKMFAKSYPSMTLT